LLSSVVPDHPSENLPALGAVHNTGKCVLAAINTLFSILPAVEVGTSYHFFLHLHIKVTGDNGVMAVFYIVLWNYTVIGYPFLR
jgi:hypothetical protein